MEHEILVTGASGAVGYAAVRALSARGHRVRGFDQKPARVSGEHVVGSLLDFDALSSAMEGASVVVHCAAVPDRQDFPSQLVPVNISGTHYLFEAARVRQVKRVVYASSVRVVGGLDWQSGVIGLDSGLVPNDHYGVSKATGELLARMYAERFGIDVLSARDAYVATPTEAGYRDGLDRETRTNVLIGITGGLAVATIATLKGC